MCGHDISWMKYTSVLNTSIYSYVNPEARYTVVHIGRNLNFSSCTNVTILLLVSIP